MKNTRASLRYAKALFESTKESGTLEEVMVDIRFLENIISDKQELFRLLHNPTINKKTKEALFLKAFKGKLHPTTMRFLIMILNKGRESMLWAIINKYIKLYRKEKQVIFAEIVSSKPLGEDLKQKIKQRIGPNYNIELNEVIDKNILGGFIIKYGDLQYDASVRNKLNNVKRAFKL